MIIRPRRLIRTGIALLCVAAIGCVSTRVYADPSSAELEQKTNDRQGQLNGLNSQLSTLLKEMDELSTEAEELKAEIEESQKAFDKAQKNGEEHYEAMKLRIKYMYEAGNTSFLEMLLSAENMSDFLNKSEFIQNVSEYDRNMMNELIKIQDEIKEDGEKLEKKHEELTAKQDELKVKRKQVEATISSTSAQLNDYTEQLARARQAEAEAAAAAAAEEARRAAEEAERLAKEAAEKKAADAAEKAKAAEEARKQAEAIEESEHYDVPDAVYVEGSTEGKTNLGNFRITHYCPCYYCCGKWAGGRTASGTIPTPGRTIAVDPKVIPLGSEVVINGQVFVAEDTGGAIKGNRIDVFVANHATALAKGVYYADVYMDTGE